MPKGRYTIGGKGTHGCKGYPVVGDTGKVHGCHATRAEAEAQQAAIYASEAQKSMDSNKDPEDHSEDSDHKEERDMHIENNESGFGWSGMFNPGMTKAKKPNYGGIIKPRKGKPADKELYARVIAEAKRKFEVYPSAVANAWVVQEYKRRGGKYSVSN